jgi:hypothetical protein
MWKESENLMHINQKKMTAVLFDLKALCTDQTGKHVKIMTDNQTTLSYSYIRDFGGSHSINCNPITRQIWCLARNKNMWLSIAMYRANNPRSRRAV